MFKRSLKVAFPVSLMSLIGYQQYCNPIFSKGRGGGGRSSSSRSSSPSLVNKSLKHIGSGSGSK